MRRILILFTLALSINVTAQNINYGGLFPTIDHSGILSDKWGYSFYYFGGINLINPEIVGTKAGPNLFVFYSEQALHYSINDKLSLTGSYVYERQHPFENNYRNENRFYVQGTYKYNLNRTILKHRIRYDGRFIENRVTNETPYTSRLRYQFGVSTPLKKESDKLYFSMYNEFFFNLDKSATAIYGENWAYVGIGYKTQKIGTWEVGPLYIFWVANKQNDLINFYYLQLSWITHLDFRKNKS